MKIIRFSFILFALFLTACLSSNREVGIEVYGARTNYVRGATYILQKPAFLFKYQQSDSKEIPRLEALGSAGTPRDLQEFLKFSHQYYFYSGLLMPGDRIRVIKFIESKSYNIGNFLHVIAVVETGESRGTSIRLDCMSTTGPGPVVMIDSEYLVPLGAPSSPTELKAPAAN